MESASLNTKRSLVKTILFNILTFGIYGIVELIRRIFEKKKKKDEFYPTDNEQISRSKIRVGDSLKLSLRTDATYNLYKGLMNLYELKQEIGTTELGVSRYRMVDSALAAITRKLKDDPSAISLLSTDGNFDFVKTLLRALSTSESVEKLKEILETAKV